MGKLQAFYMILRPLDRLDKLDSPESRSSSELFVRESTSNFLFEVWEWHLFVKESTSNLIFF